MKSITATTHRAINYGAVLQSFALHDAQKKLGIDNELLDYPKRENLYEKILTPFSKRTIISVIMNSLHFFHGRRSKRLLRRFHQFVEENIQHTDVCYDMKKLEDNYPHADFYINGSDQVFGLRGEYDKMRMLRFGPGTLKRYSYAASLGEYDWNQEEKKVFASVLEQYSMISVREKYAKEYIESFANVQCEIHMDPVFLVTKDKWESLAAEPITDEPYILCYPLIGNDNIQKVLNKLKELTGLKIICVQTFPAKRIKADEYVFDAGPKEFLSLFKHASYVVTTSFHGTAFSLIFEKNFYTLIKNYKSQRMTDLLELVGLSDRIYSEDIEVGLKPIDFANCRNVINFERERGIAYLQSIKDDVTTRNI